MQPGSFSVRDAYLRWLRTEGLLLATPLVSIAVAQLAISATPEYPPPPDGLRTMLLAFAVGAVAFGRALKRRPREAGGSHTPDQALALIRGTSRMLLIAAIAPSLLALVLVPMSRSFLDLYVMLGLTLIGVITLLPRFVQWKTWFSSLTETRAE